MYEEDDDFLTSRNKIHSNRSDSLIQEIVSLKQEFLIGIKCKTQSATLSNKQIVINFNQLNNFTKYCCDDLHPRPFSERRLISGTRWQGNVLTELAGCSHFFSMSLPFIIYFLRKRSLVDSMNLASILSGKKNGGKASVLSLQVQNIHFLHSD